MKINKDNIYVLPEREQKLVSNLLDDLHEINLYTENQFLYIDWQDYHDEYSPERVDPCPDYYGYYTLRFGNSDEVCGVEMNIETLDTVLCTLYNYIIE